MSRSAEVTGNQRHKRRDNSSGFTLIELLVTVTIMSILMGVILGGSGYARRARMRARATADVNHLDNGLVEYNLQYGEYPAPITIAGRTERGIDIAVPTFRAFLPENFLVSQTNDYAEDPWTVAIVYSNVTGSRAYSVYSKGFLNGASARRPDNPADDIYPNM